MHVPWFYIVHVVDSDLPAFNWKPVDMQWQTNSPPEESIASQYQSAVILDQSILQRARKRKPWLNSVLKAFIHEANRVLSIDLIFGHFRWAHCVS